MAIAAHLLSIGLSLAVLPLAQGSDRLNLLLITTFASQVTVFLGCLCTGVVLLARGDRGIGLGLLVGWAVGVLVLPVVGVGVCVAVLNVLGTP
jgi:hypothetical protein